MRERARIRELCGHEFGAIEPALDVAVAAASPRGRESISHSTRPLHRRHQTSARSTPECGLQRQQPVRLCVGWSNGQAMVHGPLDLSIPNNSSQTLSSSQPLEAPALRQIRFESSRSRCRGCRRSSESTHSVRSLRGAAQSDHLGALWGERSATLIRSVRTSPTGRRAPIGGSCPSGLHRTSRQQKVSGHQVAGEGLGPVPSHRRTRRWPRYAKPTEGNRRCGAPPRAHSARYRIRPSARRLARTPSR